MLFFWTLFEGSVEYVAPLKITQSGFSETFLGLLIGSSSVFGALFDLYLSHYFTNTHFRRIFLLMFAISFVFPLLLWKGTLLFYIFAMVAWGIYYDLSHFGIYDYVGRKISAENHSKQFGMIEIYKSLGFILSPLIIGLTIGNIISWQPFVTMMIFLLIGLGFYMLLIAVTNKDKQEYIHERSIHNMQILKEIRLWKSLGRKLLPVLLLTLLFHMIDSAIWTIGPLLSESYKVLHPFNGLLLTLYSIPPIFVGWFVGSITKRYGKKKTAFVSFILGALSLSAFMFLHDFITVLLCMFVTGLFISFSLPAIEGAYADYISETGKVEKEIEAVIDFFTNLGFIVGPILAGLLADLFGNADAFSLLGIVSAWLAFLLLRITPKHITIRVNESLLANS